MEVKAVAEAVEAFLDHRRSKRVSKDTLRIYGDWLTTWQQWRWRAGRGPKLGDVTVAELRTFFRYLEEEYVAHARNPRRRAADTPGLSENSRLSCWRVLKSLWRFCTFEGWLTEEQTYFFANGRLPAPQVDEEIRPHCDDAKLDELLAAAGDGSDEESARNQAILLVLYETGLRVTELCRISDDDVQLAKRRAKVWGKGRNHAYVFWGPRAGQALRRYLRLRRGKTGGPLFRGVSSRNPGGALTADAVRGMIKRLGVEVPEGAPVHFLRHGYAHKLMDDKVEGARLQGLMRHKSFASTLRYTRENPDRLQEIHKEVFGD